jgi:hypothetical protein
MRVALNILPERKIVKPSRTTADLSGADIIRLLASMFFTLTTDWTGQDLRWAARSFEADAARPGVSPALAAAFLILAQACKVPNHEHEAR